MLNAVKKLHVDGGEIAYQQTSGSSPISVCFFHGYKADMNGNKVSRIHEFCSKNNIGFTRFDYFGHGQSSMEFDKCMLSHWKQNCFDVIETVTTGQQIIIGSSMGGWLMLHAAMQFPDRISGLIGLAPSPNFVDRFIQYQLPIDLREELMSTGKCDMISGDGSIMHMNMKFVEDAKRNNIPDKVAFSAPVTLIHGMQDDVVPYQSSIDLAQRITSDDIHIHLIKHENHVFHAETSSDLICGYIIDSISRIK